MSTGGRNWHRFSGGRKKGKGGSNCKVRIGEDNDMPTTDPVIEVRPKKNKNVTVAPPPQFFFHDFHPPKFFFHA
jgi:hypothetical protein